MRAALTACGDRRAAALKIDCMAHLLAAATTPGLRCTALPAVIPCARLPSLADNIKFRLWHKYAPLSALLLRLRVLLSVHIFILVFGSYSCHVRHVRRVVCVVSNVCF